MLIRFNVGNFLSFDEIREFSMISEMEGSNTGRIYNDGKLKLLKFSAVYGANASGKSNLIKALEFMQETVTKTLPEKHTAKYCRTDRKNSEKNSYFELELKVGDKYFSYGFEVLLEKSFITSEWLYEILPENEEAEIFFRDTKSGEYRVEKYFSDKKIVNKLEVYADDVKTDGGILFLRLMNRNKDGFYRGHKEACVLKDIFQWFKLQLDINYPDRPITDNNYFITDDNIDEVSRIISAFGTGISRINIVKVSADNFSKLIPSNLSAKISKSLEDMKKDSEKNSMFVRNGRKAFFILELDEEGNTICKTIEFSHGDTDMQFSLEEESDGTIRILDFLEVLLNKVDEKVYILDEIDRCLHPQLTYKFIEIFLEIAQEKNVQLIVTTHESRLLDFNLLRRDEIWFVNRKDDGSSDIYSLNEYNMRFDSMIDVAYLEGRYGGVPVFKNVFSSVINEGKEEYENQEEFRGENSDEEL